MVSVFFHIFVSKKYGFFCYISTRRWEQWVKRNESFAVFFFRALVVVACGDIEECSFTKNGFRLNLNVLAMSGDKKIQHFRTIRAQFQDIFLNGTEVFSGLG